MNEPIAPLGFTRPAHARLCGSGGGTVRLADGTLQHVSRGQLAHLLAAQQAPVQYSFKYIATWEARRMA